MVTKCYHGNGVLPKRYGNEMVTKCYQGNGVLPKRYGNEMVTKCYQGNGVLPKRCGNGSDLLIKFGMSTQTKIIKQRIVLIFDSFSFFPSNYLSVLICYLL